MRGFCFFLCEKYKTKLQTLAVTQTVIVIASMIVITDIVVVDTIIKIIGNRYGIAFLFGEWVTLL